jgi:hypothetical protein
MLPQLQFLLSPSCTFPHSAREAFVRAQNCLTDMNLKHLEAAGFPYGIGSLIFTHAWHSSPYPCTQCQVILTSPSSGNGLASVTESPLISLARPGMIDMIPRIDFGRMTGLLIVTWAYKRNCKASSCSPEETCQTMHRSSLEALVTLPVPVSVRMLVRKTGFPTMVYKPVNAACTGGQRMHLEVGCQCNGFSSISN